MRPRSTILLDFDADDHPGGGKALRLGLSAVVPIGDTLWLANDETAALERLTAVPSDHGRFADHRRFPLADYLTLPAHTDEEGEVDIEGLDCRDGYLWLVGSHSLKRRTPERQRETRKNIERLGKIRSDGNRYLLARIPLIDREGRPTLSKSALCGDRPLTAARLAGDHKGNELTELLKEDDHLAPFLRIPGKDNGLDIEGLAVGHHGSLFLGLRGPVLRGWAVIIELRPEAPPGAETLSLDPLAPDHPKASRYRKHFVDLGGLGIRDLCTRGRDLLILAGPTMALDGPVILYRWPDGAAVTEASLVENTQLEPLLDIPYGHGDDHAEGVALMAGEEGERDALLVVYDSPAQSRLLGERAVLADTFHLPKTPG